MNSDRIEELMKATAYPESQSVYSALMQVWNECSQESNIKLQAVKDDYLSKIDGLVVELEKKRTADMSYDIEMQLNIAVETLKELRGILTAKSDYRTN